MRRGAGHPSLVDPRRNPPPAAAKSWRAAAANADCRAVVTNACSLFSCQTNVGRRDPGLAQRDPTEVGLRQLPRSHARSGSHCAEMRGFRCNAGIRRARTKRDVRVQAGRSRQVPDMGVGSRRAAHARVVPEIASAFNKRRLVQLRVVLVAAGSGDHLRRDQQGVCRGGQAVPPRPGGSPRLTRCDGTAWTSKCHGRAREGSQNVPRGSDRSMRSRPRRGRDRGAGHARRGALRRRRP